MRNLLIWFTIQCYDFQI